MNGPLKFLTARKILPLVDSMICSQNLNECSLARARTSSCGSESKGHKRNNYIEQPYRTLLYRHKCFTRKLVCKTVRIFAYSNAREQSNKSLERSWGSRATLTLRFTDFFTDPPPVIFEGAQNCRRDSFVDIWASKLLKKRWSVIALSHFEKKTDCFAVYWKIYHS